MPQLKSAARKSQKLHMLDMERNLGPTFSKEGIKIMGRYPYSAASSLATSDSGQITAPNIPYSI